MPADRTSRASKRSKGVDGAAQLTWTLPVTEPSAPSSIAFATNLTPCTFNDPPPLVDPIESSLFPASCDGGGPRKPGHNKKKPDNHIPRPPNAFILFRSSFIKSQHVSTDVETNHSTLSKIIGLTWQNLPAEERSVWHQKAKAALDEHHRRFPEYTFKPLHAKRTASEKRKVREVGPKDLKRCEKIAALLVEGLKGAELDAAIEEFDRTHVPEVVTRFEAPLTVNAYRRSLSVPPPDTEHKKGSKVFRPSESPHKPRAASSQPTRNSSPCPSEAPTEATEMSQDSQATFGSDAFDAFYDSFTSGSPTENYPSPTGTFIDSPTDGYAFPPKCDTSSFESFFSFDEQHSPIGMQSQPMCQPMFNFQPHPQLSAPAPLHINTAFTDPWAQCQSPAPSPLTPWDYSAPPSAGVGAADSYYSYPAADPAQDFNAYLGIGGFDVPPVSVEMQI